MSKPVNTIKITKTRTKSKIDTCKILIDRKEFEDHLNDEFSPRGVDRKHFIIEPLKLIETKQGSGEYRVFNCTCGYAECTGMRPEIEVVHEEEFVKWTCCLLGVDSPDLFISFKFHKPQYITQLANLE